MSSSSTGAGQEGNKASDSVDQSEGLNPETALPVPKAEDSPLQAPQRGRSRGRQGLSQFKHCLHPCYCSELAESSTWEVIVQGKATRKGWALSK